MPLLSTHSGASARSYGWSTGTITTLSDYELIGTTTVGTSTSTVVLSSISQDYKHLQVVIQVNTTGAANTDAWLQVNSVTSGYKRWYLQTTYTGHVGSGDTGPALYFGQTPGNSDGDVYSNVTFNFPDYTNQRKFRTIHGNMTTLKDLSGTWYNAHYGCMVPTKSAITSLTIGSFSGNVRAGTVISIYGMRAN